jgi:hypothetical protein
VSYWDNTKGYLFIFILCLIERFMLQWLKDRFGCNEYVFGKIHALKERIKELKKRKKDIEDKSEGILFQIKKNLSNRV